MTDHTFLPLRHLRESPPPPDRGPDFEPLAMRRRWLRGGDPPSGAEYVLYWMQMYHRGRENPALNEAIRRAGRLELPVVVYQGLNHDYPGANDRIHRFILESARDTARALYERDIPYVFHLDRGGGERRRAAAEMIRASALTVVDDFPAFILPSVTRRALELTEGSGVPVLAFDANGVVPLREFGRREYAARTLRPKIHRLLPSYLHPVEEVEAGRTDEISELPVRGIEGELREADGATLDRLVATCAIDHDVLPSLRFEGGREAALARLEAFVSGDLARYAEDGREPGAFATSELSPYLHFGCLDPREVALRILEAGDAPDDSVDAFLEQLIVRRELAYNFCLHSDAHASLDDLPDWAKETLAEHADDSREHVYRSEELEGARTHDGIWNAAERELVATGHVHNYLRMLWGKKIIRWSTSYEAAQRRMIDLHHRYALDGRNPNTYANILWCFGLHDRAWQETPVLGKVRPMTSRSTRRKFDLDPYLRQVDAWADERRMPVLEAAGGG